MAMYGEDIVRAIREAREYCADKEQAYKNGDKYESFSLREVLMALGYARDADLIIRCCAMAGFSYCVDPIVPVKEEDGNSEHPPRFACVWGVDQLRSRLDCIDLGAIESEGK